jgi:hypothetical protein
VSIYNIGFQRFSHKQRFGTGPFPSFPSLTHDAIKDLTALWEASKWPHPEVIQIWARLFHADYRDVNGWVVMKQTQSCANSPSDNEASCPLYSSTSCACPSLEPKILNLNPCAQHQCAPLPSSMSASPFFHKPYTSTTTLRSTAKTLLEKPAPAPCASSSWSTLLPNGQEIVRSSLLYYSSPDVLNLRLRYPAIRMC